MVKKKEVVEKGNSGRKTDMKKYYIIGGIVVVALVAFWIYSASFPNDANIDAGSSSSSGAGVTNKADLVAEYITPTGSCWGSGSTKACNMSIAIGVRNIGQASTIFTDTEVKISGPSDNSAIVRTTPTTINELTIIYARFNNIEPGTYQVTATPDIKGIIVENDEGNEESASFSLT